jgi:hypothetical protein
MARNAKSHSSPQSKATSADADIVLKLYELRREPELRKARKFIMFEFSPHNEKELLELLGAFGTDHQTYWRMVSSYWDQAAALVVRGAVHPGLFHDFASELYFLYAKYREFIPAVRREFNPEAWVNIEKVANHSKESREAVARFERIIAERFRPRAAKTGS